MKKIILLLIFSLFLASCSDEQKQEVRKYYKTAEVSSGIVNTDDNFIGYTKGIKQAMLSPKMAGRITYMGKKVGDKVYAGNLLASLDSSEAKNGYSTANRIVNDLYSIREKTEKALDEQIIAMEKKIEGVKAQVSGVTIGLEDTKKITESQLEVAKANLEETKKELKTNKEVILTGAKSSLTHSSIIANNSIDFVEKLLGMNKSNDSFNSSIKNYLGKRNTEQLNYTESLYREIKPEYEEYKTFYKQKIEDKEDISEETLIEGLEKAKKLLNKIKKLLNETYDVVDNSIENVYMPLTMINEFKKQITELGANIENILLSTSGDVILGIEGSLENLKTFETKKQKAISLLEKQVAQYEAMALGQVNSVETKKNIADLGLSEATAGLEALKSKKQATLSEIDTKISEALGKKDEAAIMINNGKVIAPFSGIVVNKMSEVGQVTNAGMPLYEIADNSKIKLKINVPANILQKLSHGEKLDVRIESTNKVYSGIITNLSKSANPITKKYEVEIILDNKAGEIPVGEMSIVSFNSDFKSKENEFKPMIPNSAIIEKFMIPGVYVLDGKKAVFKKIKITKMGEFFSEVEGLKSGEKIITDGKENIYDGEILK